ncbi:MAG: pantetheine-phosphate adenylyltransferase [Candidatus Omnitrophota bacterium]
MAKKDNRAVYPGTFDPVTYGHIDIVKRASKIFDRLIVAVAEDSGKKTLFSVSERKSMLASALQGVKNVSIDSFKGLVVSYAKKKGSTVIVRGVRMISDFEYEFQMALTNRKLCQDIETVYLMPHESYSYISSRLIKEAAGLGADVSDFVPKKVSDSLIKRLAGKKR